MQFAPLAFRDPLFNDYLYFCVSEMSKDGHSPLHNTLGSRNNWQIWQAARKGEAGHRILKSFGKLLCSNVPFE